MTMANPDKTPGLREAVDEVIAAKKRLVHWMKGRDRQAVSDLDIIIDFLWIDLMADEFKRIRALSDDSEIKQLCDRAVTNIHQRVNVINQRDEWERKHSIAQSRIYELEDQLKAAALNAAPQTGAALFEGGRRVDQHDCREAMKPGRFYFTSTDGGNWEPLHWDVIEDISTSESDLVEIFCDPSGNPIPVPMPPCAPTEPATEPARGEG